MYDINLLPHSKKRREHYKLILYIVIGLTVLASVLYFAIFFPLRNKADVVNKAKEYSADADVYSKLENKREQLLVELDTLQKREQSLEPLLTRDIYWSQLLSEIDTNIPSSIVLMSFTYNGDSVSMQGRAPSDVEVAQLSVVLQKTEWFDSVRITSIENDKQSGLSSFLISCKFNLSNRLISTTSVVEDGGDNVSN